MTRSRLEPFFLESSAGRIFLLMRGAVGATRCVLFVPPFAEEMNKCRRQFTFTAQALVEKGYAALLVDLFGTGDSEGEFAEATWERWKTDIAVAIAWVDDNAPELHAIVGTRLGCALSAESLRTTGRSVARSVFWQPVDNGRQFLTQFLRLRVAASMMDSGGNETVEVLKQRLAGGETLEVGGYALSPELWREIDAVELSASLAPSLGKLALFEIGRPRDGELSPAGKHLAASAERQGIETTAARIAGEPFWTATEIVVNSELAQRTTAYITSDTAP